MRLTDEQRAVIESDNQVSIINAVAGSGKTTTLIEYAACRPRERILYLAYNRSAAAELKERLLARNLKHVAVSTMHGLAYRYTGSHSLKLEGDISEWRLLDQYVPAAERATEHATLYAWLLKDLLNFYLNSDIRALDDSLLRAHMTITAPSDQAGALIERHGEEMLAILRNILADMRAGRTPAIHDFYLKLFQFVPARLPYDLVMVDEAQDVSPVMLAIVRRQSHLRQIFVGDSFQQIYGFRFAIDSLGAIEGNRYWLTQTFRFGDKLARHLSAQINNAYEILDETISLQIRGTEQDTRFGKQVRKQQSHKTVIARSNLSLFESVIEHITRNARNLYFEGGHPGYGFLNSRVVGLYYLKEGQAAKINDPFIQRFPSFDEVKRFAQDAQSQALSLAWDLVQRHGSRLFEFDRSIKERLVAKQYAQAVFTTTHKAKGQEYEDVEMVQDDFTTREDLARLYNSGKSDLNPARLKEEINIYYVAATRAKNSIRLADF
ncbi:AAA family ATPase [Candidatus Methylospira mobilis]|uniref:AAA family ATPase n=1 Tax=Candidatus Methylospira mobilis TaxID=1808979 RepID=A0A5Q0BIG3_9GAMM|nr:UvrD-helicase domain-containing protein [Candidatus Methylospira mobilis]QFY41991.1 AAA family ATPase [Candidatus Methylospira mobilis]WNV02983.1 UvrD-helicase domain-containing protein [Candidatus Methylospira mobilis]